MDYFRHKLTGEIFEPKKTNEICGTFYVLDENFEKIKCDYLNIRGDVMFKVRVCYMKNVEPFEKKIHKKTYKTLF